MNKKLERSDAITWRQLKMQWNAWKLRAKLYKKRKTRSEKFFFLSCRNFTFVAVLFSVIIIRVQLYLFKCILTYLLTITWLISWIYIPTSHFTEEARFFDLLIGAWEGKSWEEKSRYSSSTFALKIPKKIFIYLLPLPINLTIVQCDKKLFFW